MANVAPGEVLGQVRDLLPDIRDRAPQGDANRRLPEATIKDLVATGLMRLLQPKRYGGLEGDPREFYESVMAIGTADGSAAWVAGVVGVHPWQIAGCDDRLQREIWGEDPDTLVSSTYMPAGVLTPVEGGYRLTGRWQYSSGSDHCQWVVLGTKIKQEDGSLTMGGPVWLPRQDYVIEDTWDTLGLRGTGSNDIIVDDVFVPAYRTLPVTQQRPENFGNDGPLYALSFGNMFSTAITAPVLGLAQGMVDEALAFYATRESSAHGKALEKDPYTIAKIGEAAREVDACRLLLMRDFSEMYETVQAGGQVTMDQRIRTRRDQILGTARAVAAIDQLFDRAGAGVIASSHPMSRIFRDAHSARHHTANTPLEPSLFNYTVNAMGLGPGMDPLI
jgi:3-hydroxy-9,10-secoandrosta-1,3,5(10)-triene-9,17-dione monooxygenase